jgi:hypothetical protein
LVIVAFLLLWWCQARVARAQRLVAVKRSLHDRVLAHQLANARPRALGDLLGERGGTKARLENTLDGVGVVGVVLEGVPERLGDVVPGPAELQAEDVGELWPGVALRRAQPLGEILSLGAEGCQALA